VYGLIRLSGKSCVKGFKYAPNTTYNTLQGLIGHDCPCGASYGMKGFIRLVRPCQGGTILNEKKMKNGRTQLLQMGY
jgi:hypothetical protein